MYQLGVDEAGRGPAIGPLVVCALGVPIKDRKILSSIQPRDSKALSSKKRKALSEKIYSEIEQRNWKVGMITCSASRIDREREHSNLNMLEVELFKDSIDATEIHQKKGIIYVDACDVNEERFGNQIKELLGKEWDKWAVESRHKMDSDNDIVSAASILAKVHRDEEIKRIGQDLEMDIGSGYPSDPKTKIAIRKLVVGEYPNKYLRWTWATTERIWMEENNKPLPRRSHVEGNTKQSTISDW
tara:strand:+ start:2728 stop:3456 length:729 start_codon:yes stop_codon:yes gene_type:complete